MLNYYYSISEKENYWLCEVDPNTGLIKKSTERPRIELGFCEFFRDQDPNFVYRLEFNSEGNPQWVKYPKAGIPYRTPETPEEEQNSPNGVRTGLSPGEGGTWAIPQEGEDEIDALYRVNNEEADRLITEGLKIKALAKLVREVMRTYTDIPTIEYQS